MSVVVKNPDGQLIELGSSAVALGVGTETRKVGRQLEVVGTILARSSEDVGGTAIGFGVEGPGIGHVLINADYNVDQPSKHNRRVLTLADGNVGIGKDFSTDNRPAEKLVVQGNIVATGDVRLEGADCAEEFDAGDVALEPGVVLVIGEGERLQQCAAAYDTKVAGVFSGAGTCRPAIILGRQPSSHTRVPLALTGKVYCKVDAGYSPVEVGDLLTTSLTPGHAMKVCDPRRAHGAVLGKALRPLREGRSLIPILVTLQ